MKARLIKELYWILGTIILFILTGLILFGKALFNGRSIEIQLHDTYFVFAKSFLLTIIFIGFLTTNYLIKVLYYKGNDAILNSILVLLLMILFVILVF